MAYSLWPAAGQERAEEMRGDGQSEVDPRRCLHAHAHSTGN